MATALQEWEQARSERREALRVSLLKSLRNVLRDLYCAGSRVWVFGSLIRQGRFREDSDVDLAVETAPANRSLYWLQGELEARLGCAVDVLLLPETRLRSKIEREGEMWTL